MQSKILKNGTQLIQIPITGTKAVTVFALFPVGSRYEMPQVAGASHFVEHMIFKGTPKRPEAVHITRELDRVGAQYNAFTNKEYTGYYIKIDSKKQQLAFELLNDMLFHSTFSAEEVEKEKGAIMEELHMYEDDPGAAADLQLDRLMFHDHTLGVDIVGSEKTVKGITRDELFAYYRSHYAPGNMILVVAGDVNKKKLPTFLRPFLAEAKDAASWPLTFYKKNLQRFVFAPAVALADRMVVTQRTVDQAKVIMGFPGLPLNHSQQFVARLLLSILGGGMSSRLFVEVREKRGLAYSVSAGQNNFRDTGAVFIEAGLDPKRLGEAYQVILAELHKLKTELVSEEELQNAKHGLSGRLALRLEDSLSQAEWAAKQLMFHGKIMTYHNYLQALKKVTALQIKKLANQWFDLNSIFISAVGPFTKDEFRRSLEENFRSAS